MLFTVPFGLLLMCFALLFGLSAVGDDSDIIGGESGRAGRRRWPGSRQRGSRRLRSRRQDAKWGRNSQQDDFTSRQSAADYLGYEAGDSAIELAGESYEETARRLEEEAQLHLQQIMGDGT